MAKDPGERYPSAGDLGQAALAAAGGAAAGAVPGPVLATGEAAPRGRRARRGRARAPRAGAPRREGAIGPAGRESLSWAIALAGLLIVAVAMVAAPRGISTSEEPASPAAELPGDVQIGSRIGYMMALTRAEVLCDVDTDARWGTDRSRSGDYTLRRVVMPTLPLVGQDFAGYRLRAVLGRGGMSVVYEAENVRLGNTVALKVLAPELSTDDAFRARFLKESRLAASLNHPNVIPIYDTGPCEDLLYIAMRYVAGSDLRTVLDKHGRISPDQALLLVGQAGRALDAAHRLGLVHRDVKPANVLIERGADGDPDHVYLADFGLTKHTAVAQRAHRDRPAARDDRLHRARSRSRARTWTAGRTSTRWAACSTSASPAGSRS